MSTAITSLTMQRAQAESQMLEKAVLTMGENDLTHRQFIAQQQFESMATRSKEAQVAMIRFLGIGMGLLGDIHSIVR